MVEAPERIWASSVTENYGEWQTVTDGMPRPTEYVRADLVTLSDAVAEREAEPVEEELVIDQLRLKAFATNSPADRDAYFNACSKWFQDRHYRRLSHTSELEALRKRVAELDRLNVGLHAEMQFMRERAIANARERNAAEARVAELEKAMEPLADIADLIDAETEGMSEIDELELHFHDYLMASWPVAMFRTARRVREGRKVDGS